MFASSSMAACCPPESGLGQTPGGPPAATSRIRRRAWIHVYGVCLLMAAAGFAEDRPFSVRPMELAASDRVLVLAPHPDDEVLACGGVIQRCLALRIPVRVVYFTYGDNNEWSFLIYRKHAVLLPGAVKQMGLLRHEEAVQAGRAFGLAPEQLNFLGYPDFGTYHIWTEHWGSEPPFESMLTRVVSVPYKNAFRPGAPYSGEAIMQDLRSILREFKPTKVFVSHPSDFNTDHRALYLFTQVTLWTLEKELNPEVFPYLVHFPKWPSPRGRWADRAQEPPAVLARSMEWRTLALSSNEVSLKETALQCHKTQYEYAAKYLNSFIRVNELFGNLPPLRFPGGTSLPAEMAQEQGGEKEPEADSLTESERARFIGVEWRRIHVADEALMISITLSRPLAETVAAEVQVEGYRADREFGSMPKMKVRIGRLEHVVLDRRHVMPSSAVSVKRGLKDIEVRIPLETLGRPERLLVSARTYIGDIPLDWVSWRVVDLRDEKK